MGNLLAEQKVAVKIDTCKKATFVKAIMLDGARKDKVFGEYDWECIIIDQMYAMGYTLISDGQAAQRSKSEYGRQEIKLLFLSAQKQSAPPIYNEGGKEAVPAYTNQRMICTFHI